MAKPGSNDQQQAQTIESTAIGTNFTVSIEGDEIVLRIKKDMDLGPSKSKKTRLVATSGGFTTIPGTNLSFSGSVCKPK